MKTLVASILSDNSLEAIKTRFLNRDSEAGRSESTSPSLQHHLRYSKLGQRSVSKDTPVKRSPIEPIDRLERHTATIKSLNQTSLSMTKVKRKFKRGETSFSTDETSKLPEVEWSGPIVRYIKKNPPSLYNSSRNVQSFEHYTARQEVFHRIQLVGELAEVINAGAKKEVTRPLKEIFEYCVETESKSYFHVWFKLLRTFETMFSALNKKNEKKPTEELIDDNSFLTNDLDQIMNKDMDYDNPKDDTMENIVRDLSKLWRTATHKITNRDLFTTLETIWNALVKILNKSINAQSARVVKAFEAINDQTKIERSRQKRLMELMVKSYEEKFVELNNDISALKRTIDRLKKDKEEVEELVKDRNAEIHKLRQPPDTRDFRRMIGELTDYLDETEIRQEKQASILESIGKLIKVDFTDRVTRLKHSLKIATSELTILEPPPEPKKVEIDFKMSKGTMTDLPKSRGRNTRLSKLTDDVKAKILTDDVKAKVLTVSIPLKQETPDLVKSARPFKKNELAEHSLEL